MTEGEQLTLDVCRDVDLDYLARAEAFIRDQAEARKPFFVYFNHSLMHMPVIPREQFRGLSGNGDWADALLELDADFATLLDLLDDLGLTEDTVVVFAGDNGPEEILTWRGSPGYWEGSYFAGGEGNLRTPCIVRWPGRVPAGEVSNDIMHVTDWFTTLLQAAGAGVPQDRVIDGIDQLPWLTGAREELARDGFPYWMGSELYGVKWHDFKLVLKEQKYSTDSVGDLPAPHLVNLITDPQEREAMDVRYLHSWVVAHINRILGEYRSSTRGEPPIPPASPVGFVPHRGPTG